MKADDVTDGEKLEKVSDEKIDLTENHTQNLISVKNLSFSYENAEKPALKGVSLDVNKGDYIAILGSNGSGKSTLAKLIAGFLPLQEGIIEIQQTGPCTIGYVQQNPKYQIIATIVEKDTAFGPQVMRLSQDEIQQRTAKSLEIVDLTEKAKANTNSLSLGQTQKLALAGILALHPDVLFLDEAVSMIDPETRASILSVVDELYKKGKTIIHITHDIESANKASRVIVVEKGEKIFDGTKDAFFADKSLCDGLFAVKNPEVYERLKRAKEKFGTKDIAKDIEKDIALAFDKVSFSYGKSPDSMYALDESFLLENAELKKAELKKNVFEKAVDDVSLAFRRGTITAVLGKSGSGKSTLFELGTSLLAPSSGRIFANGKTSLALQDAEGALFQSVAADDVAFGPENQGLKGAELRERVKKSMDLCGVPFSQFKDRSILELSGGEKRKIALAGIVAMDNDIIFFDEPTSSLDPKSREQFFVMVQKLADEQHKTIVFSTHNENDALAADRVIHISRGKVLDDTSPVEIPLFDEEKENLRYKEHSNLLSSLRNISLGEYEAKNSLVHRMPILAKTIVFFVLFILTTMFPQMQILLPSCFLALLYAAFADFSVKKLLFRMLKIFPWILFFFVWQVLLFPIGPDDIVYWSWHFLKITDENILSLLRMVLHFFGAMTTISVFVYTTETTEILDGMQKRFHVNVFVFFMLLLRFIPLLTEELSHIVKTQIIREGIKSTKGFVNKVKAILPIIIPIIVQTIRRSTTIAEALEARGMK